MTPEQLMEMVKDHPPGDLIDKYIKARDAKKEVERLAKLEAAKFQDFMDAVEIELMRKLDESKTDNLSVRGVGVAYRKFKTQHQISNWDLTIAQIQREQMWHMLTHNVRKEAVEEYMAAHDGKTPDGVEWRVEQTVEIRRK